MFWNNWRCFGARPRTFRKRRRRDLPDDVEKRVVVRHENLDVITHLGQLSRRAHEIRNRTRISVPDEHVKTLTTQIFCDPASNDTEPDYTDIFIGSTRHLNWMRPFRNGWSPIQPAVKTGIAQLQKFAWNEARRAANSQLPS